MRSPTDTHDDELIAISTAAAVLGVATDTVRRWEREGRITSLRTLGGHRRFSRAAIEALRDTSAA